MSIIDIEIEKMKALEKAWHWREQRGFFNSNEALRIFYGPGEGEDALSKISIDRYLDHYWITSKGERQQLEYWLPKIENFLKSKKAQTAVWILRPEGALSQGPQVLFGTPPAEPFQVNEAAARYWIKMQKSLHPGLFLDQAPLRVCLMQHCKGLRVLNTFSYTGSLSVACGLAGAHQVVSLDLSRPSVEWARKNWELNALSESVGRFIVGDFFEWLPRFQKRGEKFDCVILDPPSSSVGKQGRFSTARDLKKLHVLALGVLDLGGTLITSINSANVSWEKFELEIQQAARATSVQFQILKKIELPETFPTRLGHNEDRYLKGFILRKEN